MHPYKILEDPSLITPPDSPLYNVLLIEKSSLEPPVDQYQAIVIPISRWLAGHQKSMGKI